MEAATLFGTSACHLCEQAETLLAQVLASFAEAQRPQIELVDIADSDALIARYGTRIPVLRRDSDGGELDWPFDGERARRLLSGERLPGGEAISR
jgi:hypothetical protein